jgi:2'-deoxynucleoside 5'-phosphate N-hydrolase
MNIYFSCSITGGRDDQKIYAEIVRFLQSQGHEVPTANLASPDLDQLEKSIEAVDVFNRDIAWVRACDVLIAEVSTPSHGVGYEIAEAVNTKKPVLCLYDKEVRVSKMLTGNTGDHFFVRPYTNSEEIQRHISQFLLHVQ